MDGARTNMLSDGEKVDFHNSLGCVDQYAYGGLRVFGRRKRDGHCFPFNEPYAGRQAR